jgi:cytidylate kinase
VPKPKKIIVAIDGPAGSGKSTVARLLAKKMGLLYIDTGAMYRALTLKALREKIDLNDEKKLANLARATQIELKNDSQGRVRVYIDKKEVTTHIRKPPVTMNVRHIAKLAKVREIMVKKQRQMSKRSGVVLEGRDITTVVFPDAHKKFYIDARFPVRCRRRYRELRQAGCKVTLKEVTRDIKRRDASDWGRKIAPLKKAKDAIYIDTTDLNIQEVLEKVLCFIGS